MKKKPSEKKLDLNKKTIGTLIRPAAVKGGNFELDPELGIKTYQLTACELSCKTYDGNCGRSRTCA